MGSKICIKGRLIISSKFVTIWGRGSRQTVTKCDKGRGSKSGGRAVTYFLYGPFILVYSQFKMLMLFSRRIASRWIQLQIQRSVWLKLEEGSTSFSTTHSVHSKRMRRKQQINNLVLQPTDTPCRKWTAGTSPPPPVDTPCQDGTLACDPHYRNHHQHTAGQLRYHPVELQSGDSLPTPTCLHINRTTRRLLLYLQGIQS